MYTTRHKKTEYGMALYEQVQNPPHDSPHDASQLIIDTAMRDQNKMRVLDGGTSDAAVSLLNCT